MRIAMRAVWAGILLSGAPLCGAATTSTWTNTAGGVLLWSDAPNWSNGVPNGIGDVANLTADITADTFVRINTNPTVGQLTIGDPNSSNGYRVQDGVLHMNNGASDATITINQTGSSPIVFNSDMIIMNEGTGKLSITNNAVSAQVFAAISGGSTITKSGSGSVTLGGTGTWSGNTFVTAGELASHKDFLAMPATTNVILSSGSSFHALDVSVIHGVAGNGFLRTSSGQITMGAYGGFVSNTVILASGGEMRPGDTNPASPGQVGTLSLSQSSIPFTYFQMNSGGDVYLDVASASSYDQIDVFRATSNSSILGGNLHLNFLSGYAPLGGDTFNVFVGFTGTQFIDGNGGTLFDSITSNLAGGYFVASIIEGSSDTIRLTYLPEPAGAMALCGIALFGCRVRSRRPANG